MNSWWCGKNVSYDFCKNTSGSCKRPDGFSGAGHARSPDIGSGNRNDLSRVVLRHYDPAVTGAVTLYRIHDCQNDLARFMADENSHRPAEYTKEMIQDVFENNALSSVMIPYGYSLHIY